MGESANITVAGRNVPPPVPKLPKPDPARSADPAKKSPSGSVAPIKVDPETAKTVDTANRSAVLNQHSNRSRIDTIKKEIKEGWSEGGPLGVVGGALNGAGKALVQKNSPLKEPGKMGLFGLIKSVVAGTFIAAGTLINVGGIFSKNTYGEIKGFAGRKINGPDYEVAKKEYESARTEYDALNKRYESEKSKGPELKKKASETAEEAYRIADSVKPGDDVSLKTVREKSEAAEQMKRSAEDIKDLEKKRDRAKKMMESAEKRMDAAKKNMPKQARKAAEEAENSADKTSKTVATI